MWKQTLNPGDNIAAGFKGCVTTKPGAFKLRVNRVQLVHSPTMRSSRRRHIVALQVEI
jgi:hypothetical protein